VRALAQEMRPVVRLGSKVAVYSNDSNATLNVDVRVEFE
jgi:hypothetical protein